MYKYRTVDEIAFHNRYDPSLHPVLSSEAISQTVMPKLGLILGSTRSSSNGRGIAAWLSSVLETHLNSLHTNKDDPYQIVLADLTTAPHPLGPINGTIPQGIRSSDGYSSPAIQQWSAFAYSCDGFIVVTPQHNWGYPAELKAAFDHLFWEWKDKPLLLVTYGGHGGNKCAAQLRQVLGGSLEMVLLQKSLEISIPRSYIQGADRVPTTGPFPEFIVQHETSLQEAAAELVQLLEAKSQK